MNLLSMVRSGIFLHRQEEYLYRESCLEAIYYNSCLITLTLVYKCSTIIAPIGSDKI